MSDKAAFKPVSSDKPEFVCHALVQPLLQRIEELHDNVRQGRSFRQRGLLITGFSGAGKTTLMEYYESRYPKQDMGTHTLVPVITASVPSPVTIKAFVGQLLQALGDPLWEVGTEANKIERFIHHVQECKVELVILDEFQHFIEGKTNRVQGAVADFLKHLMNRLPIGFVLFGMPWSGQILLSNAQLRSRFYQPLVLEPFRIRRKRDRVALRQYVKSLQAMLPTGDLDLTQGDWLLRLFCLSRGLAGVLADYFLALRGQVERSNKKALDVAIMSRVYEDLLNYADEPNPITCPQDRLIIRDMDIINPLAQTNTNVYRVTPYEPVLKVVRLSSIMKKTSKAAPVVIEGQCVLDQREPGQVLLADPVIDRP